MASVQPQFPARINPKYGNVDWAFSGATGAKNLGSRGKNSQFDGSAYSRKGTQLGLSNYLGAPGTNTSKILLSSTAIGDFSTNWGMIVFSVPAGGVQQGLFHSYFKISTSGDGGFYIKVNSSNQVEIDKANQVALLNTSNTVRTGALNVVVWSFTDTSAAVVLNGVLTTSTFSSAGVLSDLAGFGTNQQANEGIAHDQLLSVVTVGRTLTVPQMRELCANPWRIFAERKPRRARSVSANSYTLTSAAGAFTQTGQVATLKAGRKLASATGSLTLSGQVATLKYSHVMPAAAGSYAITAQQGAIRQSHVMPGSPAGYTLTGQAATLRTGGGGLSAAPAAYSLSGQATGFLRGYRLTCSAGGITLTGRSANLVYEPAGSYVLGGAAGSISVAGQTAGSSRTYRLTAEPRAFTVAGKDAQFFYQASSDESAPIVLRAIAKHAIVSHEAKRSIMRAPASNSILG